ncbi:hypothetical protein CJF32_00000632 [Rutstroemia sp. NJR-2017a WRK4]|nr:hypothetical protein CJF32_00000632 [Rutstroemia sp. NJR-2017a WRK4]
MKSAPNPIPHPNTNENRNKETSLAPASVASPPSEIRGGLDFKKWDRTKRHGSDSLVGIASDLPEPHSKLLIEVCPKDALYSANPLLDKSQRPLVITQATTAQQAHTAKHSRPEDNGSGRAVGIVISEPPLKKSRPKFRLRHILHPENAAAGSLPESQSPQSPLLFFHNWKRSHFSPPKVSDVDAAAMSNRPRDERSIKTIKLARGKILGSPHTPASASNLQDAERSNNRSASPRSKISGNSLIDSVGILELLEQDERPTFIIDVADQKNFIPGGRLRLEYANASLRATEPILEMVTGYADLSSPTIVTNAFPEFKAWVLSFVNKQHESLDVCLPSFLYGGFTWSCSTLRKRLRVISGTHNHLPVLATASSNTANSSPDQQRGPNQPASTSIGRSSEPADYFGSVTSSPTQAETIVVRESIINDQMRSAEGSSFDWTRLPMSAALPRHVQFCRNYDWASTPLGPIETWSFDLRAMCNLIMGSPHPAAIFILQASKDNIPMLKHMQGKSYKVEWAEIWDELGEIFDKAKNAAQATMKDDDCLFLKRNGYFEETYFSWSIIPLVGEDGSVVGLYNPAWEKTRRVISERRMLTLREVGEKTAAAREVKGFWGQVIKGLEYNPYDIPFALIYSVGDDADSDMSSLHSGSLSQSPKGLLASQKVEYSTLCTITTDSLTLLPGHKIAVSPLDLNVSDDGFAPYLRESIKVDRPVLLTTEDGTLSAELIEGLEWAGFGDPCRAVVVMPLHATTGESILGFLVMGINPRRPYDDDYSLFIQLISRQLATSMASVVLFEEEIRRGQRAARLAAQDRQELSELVNLRTQEAVESENRFTRMAEMAPVGIFIANAQGEIMFCNDTWWEISRHPRSANSARSWMDSIKDEDRDGVRAVWNKLVTQKVAVTHEFRFKAPWQNGTTTTDTWALMSCAPLTDDNNLRSIFGSITNISHQKWAEAFQRMRMEEAIELKRQQENFIDMTSHEMRNPLSAILQCSDEITSSLTTSSMKALKATLQNHEIYLDLSEIVDSCLDAAQTISLCAQHQKRIVDDILTLSKLDSALLVVTPVPTQPISVAQRAIKMFEGDMEKHDIAMEFLIDDSYKELSIDWAKLDPSRLLQVLINLLTNAIKFTTGQAKRAITLRIGASRVRPAGDSTDVRYFPSRSKAANMELDDAEWGLGEDLYLKFAVQDTGRGLDKDEVSILFQRFSQASPRTHVQYGGSGLGLFISRQLTELQGGQIGVSSERGVGSSFAFYIRARRAEHVPEISPVSTPKLAQRSLLQNSSPSRPERRNSLSEKAVPEVYVSFHHRIRAKTISNQRYPDTFYVVDLMLTLFYSNAIERVKSSPKSSLDYKDITVLIVEDNLVNQRVLQKQLNRVGFVTETANHGVECLQTLEKSSFWKGVGEDVASNRLSCVLMDLEMPIMDGLSCARRIRNLESEGTIVRHVPIIAVTANARLEQIETAIAAGMDDVVSKPFRIPDLLPKIEELVTRFKSTSISESKST